MAEKNSRARRGVLKLRLKAKQKVGKAKARAKAYAGTAQAMPAAQAFERASKNARAISPGKAASVRKKASIANRAGSGAPTKSFGPVSGPSPRTSPAPRTVPIGQMPPPPSSSGVKEAVKSVGPINVTDPGRVPIGSKIGGDQRPSSGQSASAPGQKKKVLGLQSARTLAPGNKARKIKVPVVRPGKNMTRS